LVQAPVKGSVRCTIGMLVKLRIGRRLYASLEGVKGIDEEVDCKCCERTGLWLECQLKELLHRDIWIVPRETIRWWQVTHTNQMSVFVFDDIRQKPFCLAPRSAVQLPYPIQHHKEYRKILPA
jgi:hypothetical protein